MKNTKDVLIAKAKSFLAVLRSPKTAHHNMGHLEKNPAQRSMLRLSLDERIMFAKRLAMLLKAGVPILTALSMIEKQTKNRSAQYMLQSIATGMERGQSLHVCLEKFRRYFGDFAVSIVRVGETSGTLHQNLDYLAEELRKRRDLKKKIIGAMIYPLFIAIATIGITILLIVYVFPKILPVLQTFKGQLPFTTRTLIFLSALFVTKGWLILLTLAFAIATFIIVFRASRKFRLQWDTLLLRIPLMGKIFASYHIANFCRTFGVLLKSDPRIVDAVVITAKTSTNLAYHDTLMELSESLMQGKKISAFLEKHAVLFPPMVSQLVAVGETTGSLSDTLAYLADLYEKDVDEMAKRLSTSIEPMLMVFMGLLVGMIAMSIITPIYAITQNLSQ